MRSKFIHPEIKLVGEPEVKATIDQVAATGKFARVVTFRFAPSVVNRLLDYAKSCGVVINVIENEVFIWKS